MRVKQAVMVEKELGYSEDNSLKSRQSRITSPIQFVNRTGRSVTLIWINFRGEEDHSITRTLANNSNVNVNTFVTHPWIAKDEVTKERMLLNFNDVFYPMEPTIRRIGDAESRSNRRVLAVRKQVVITAPVLSLEDYCKKEIMKHVPDQSIKKLPLPQRIILKLLQPLR